MKALRLAVEKGWKGLMEIRTDPDLDPIRAEPAFAAVVEDLRKAAKP